MNTNFRAILKGYREYLQTLGYAHSTVYDFTHFTRHFFNHLIDHKGLQQISQLTDKHVKAYFSYLENKTGSRTGRAFGSSHLNRNFIAIDKLLESLHVLGMESAPIPQNHTFENIPLKEVSVLSQQEIQELYKVIDLTFEYHFYGIKRIARQKTLELVLNLCYGCGLRRSEVLNVKIKDIDFDRKVLHVRQGKNYKDRYIPINDRLTRSFMEYIYDYRGHLPTRKTGYVYPFGYTAIGQVLSHIQDKVTCESLKHKVISLHTLRHSIATHLLQNGMAIEQISAFLGHSGLTSTQLYTHILQEHGL